MTYVHRLLQIGDFLQNNVKEQSDGFQSRFVLTGIKCKSRRLILLAASNVSATKHRRQNVSRQKVTDGHMHIGSCHAVPTVDINHYGLVLGRGHCYNHYFYRGYFQVHFGPSDLITVDVHYQAYLKFFEV